MKQQQFIQQHEALWQNVEALLRNLRSASKNPLPEGVDLHQFPALYRQLCHHFAIARQRHYSPYLIDRLQTLVIACHHYFYSSKSVSWHQIMELFLLRFPQVLRRHARVFWFACAMLYLPAILLGVLSYSHDDLIYSVLPDQQVSKMESMYDPKNGAIGRDASRSSDTDFQMFGYYIFNNISIGFRCFASGLLLGIGSVVILFYNGATIGSVAGHLTRLGFGETFWPFVCGHSAFELTAIVISGCAGLVLAMAIFAPGRKTLSAALVQAGRESVVLVSGAAMMLVIAAFIEAFWSSSATIPAAVKYGVAAMLWSLVIWFLAFSGKRR